jgi:hypothetical protein
MSQAGRQLAEATGIEDLQLAASQGDEAALLEVLQDAGHDLARAAEVVGDLLVGCGERRARGPAT